jgi:hypothetical protein
MIRSRLGLKALGMCALVLGLMAVWAGAAQAEETGGNWTYKNAAGELKTFEGALAEPELGGEIEPGTVGVLDSKVLGGSLLKYECKKFTVVKGSKLQAGGKAIGSLVFTECETFINSVLNKNCNPEAGTITTKEIKGVMLLHKLGDGTIHKILIAEPVTGTTFATVKSSEACSIGLNVPIGGKFAIIPSNPTTHEVKHLITEFAALTHLFVISDTVEHKATITGSALAFLSGTHVGLNFAGLWN